MEYPDIPPVERELLRNFLAEKHEAFSLEEGERGQSDMTQLDIEMEMPHH